MALAAALAILAALLFYVFVGPTSEQSTAPVEKQAAEEEEEAEEPPAAAPAPPPPSEDPRPYPRPSSHSSGDNSAAPPITLPPLHVLSVGYSPMPAFRVVALRIGSALPYFMHEGDTIGDIKILAILHDRVQISHKGKTYEIKVGADGTPIGMPLR